jgi:hypothetical protein
MENSFQINFCRAHYTCRIFTSVFYLSSSHLIEQPSSTTNTLGTLWLRTGWLPLNVRNSVGTYKQGCLIRATSLLGQFHRPKWRGQLQECIQHNVLTQLLMIPHISSQEIRNSSKVYTGQKYRAQGNIWKGKRDI